MLGRAHRFHGYGSLNGVYRNGVRVRGKQISLQHMNRGAEHSYRVAVVVSRKTSKSAVVRNRIRRRVYEIVRNEDQIIKPGTDLVFTVFSDQVAEIESAKLTKIITDILQKALSPPTRPA